MARDGSGTQAQIAEVNGRTDVHSLADKSDATRVRSLVSGCQARQFECKYYFSNSVVQKMVSSYKDASVVMRVSLVR